MADGPNPIPLIESVMHSREQAYLRDLPDPTDAILSDWAEELTETLLYEVDGPGPWPEMEARFRQLILAAARRLIVA